MQGHIATSVVATALVLMGSSLALAQDNAPYCLKSGLGVTNCIYQTMAQCQAVKQSIDQCLTREQIGGTSGLGHPSIPPSGTVPTDRQGSGRNTLPQRN